VLKRHNSHRKHKDPTSHTGKGSVNEEQSTHKDSLAPTPKEKDIQPTSSTVIEDIFPAGKLTASNSQIDFGFKIWNYIVSSLILLYS